jgi:hypothetical protein
MRDPLFDSVWTMDARPDQTLPRPAPCLELGAERESALGRGVLSDGGLCEWSERGRGWFTPHDAAYLRKRVGRMDFGDEWRSATN